MGNQNLYILRTDNTMAKRKRTNNDLQKIYIKLKISSITMTCTASFVVTVVTA